MSAAQTEIGWEFWIDRGGTFTDIVARDPLRRLHTKKLLSDRPEAYVDAAVFGIRAIMREAGAGDGRIDSVRMGTTVATNALLERRGVPTALVITAGLGDVIRIGTQQRPDLFAIDIKLPDMLYSTVVEATERVAVDGKVIVPLDEARLRVDLLATKARGIKSVAVVFLHGYRHSRHEQRAAAIARELGFEHVSVSHRVSPLIRIVPRGDTTLVDAYLTPVLRRYVETLERELRELSPQTELLFMQSHGGLSEAAHFDGKDSLLSGPAGGIVGMARTAVDAGFEHVIGFDMGGTSTDVSLFSGTFARTTHALIGGVRIAVPMLGIHTVAAGGGSIIKYESGRLQVGPDSAGAHPGPVAYRNGGPLTITDANVLLGRIQPEHFPAVFGDTNRESLDAAAVERAFAELAATVAHDTGHAVTPEALAEGALEIAVLRMAEAIKQISIKRGLDLAEFTLASFGGAGGQHACQVAEALGVRTILIHPLAGVLSAYGVGIADLRVVLRESLEEPLEPATLPGVAAAFTRIEARGRAGIDSQRVRLERIRIERRLLLKLAGSDTTIALAWSPDLGFAELLATFEKRYVEHFGFGLAATNTAIVVESIEIEVVGEREPNPIDMGSAVHAQRSTRQRRVRVGGRWMEIPVHERDTLAAGTQVDGPALIVEANATTLIQPHWRAEVDRNANLILEHFAPESRRVVVSATTSVDPILLEVLNNAFMGVAEQMGLVMQGAAHSVNIKERMDFSCAVFDRSGNLIANAPHVPVHLGSMGATVKAVLEITGGLERGSSYVSNDPYRGGTHLPDVTVVTPVHSRSGESLEFIVASRAHHADIGGKTPGSMPPTSTTLDEEGVIIDCLEVVRRGEFREDATRRAFLSGRYPTRNVEQNIADLKAQIAANARGGAELHRLIERFGTDTVLAYVSHMYANAEQCVRRAIDRLNPGSFEVALDSGDVIAVRVTVARDHEHVMLDFAGTSPESRGNLNAPTAVATSAVLYAFRTLVDVDIPLNAGCLAPIEIRLPENCLLNPKRPAAVVGGNVETSQRITDAVFAALGVLASSQGTMNNLTFGNERYQYYETLCGGAGASATANGASAVHTHMTNSRLTDPEVLELRFPVRLLRFGIRRGSGGNGTFRGGDGCIREIQFLEPMHVAILSNCRRVAPFGLAGGDDAMLGRNALVRASGEVVALGGTAEVDVGSGDRIVIETPGGGGFGQPPADRSDANSRQPAS